MNFSRSNFKKSISAVCAALIVAGSFPCIAVNAYAKETSASDMLVRTPAAGSDELQVPLIPENVLDVPDTKVNTLKIDKLKQNVFTDAKTEITQLNGNITKKGQIDTFEFTPKRDGVHRFEFSGVGNDGDKKSFKIEVLRPDGHSESETGIDGDGCTLLLKKGEKVAIKVYQHNGTGTYTINIGNPNPVADISKYTKVKGGIAYTDQKNVYRYTAPRDGQYRFELADIDTSKGSRDTWLEIFDANGKSLDDYRGDNGAGITITLKKGQTYTVDVDYALWSGSYGSFSLLIGVPKETKDISKYTKVTDNVEFTEQLNTYTYTAPTTGHFRFGVENLSKAEDTLVSVSVHGANGSQIQSATCENGSGVTVDLTKGKKYTVKVKQNGNFTPYTLAIGVAKSTKDISSYNEVNDSIQYEEQKNIYTYTASVNGEHRFELRGLSESKDEYARLTVCDSKGEAIVYGIVTDRHGFSVNLTKGTKYSVEVEHYDKNCDYTLCVWGPKAVVDITGKKYIKDSIEHDDQVNTYTYTPAADGTYRFQIEDFPLADPENAVDGRLKDPSGETVGSEIYGQRGEYFDAELKKGVTYTLTMTFDRGCVPYTLVIAPAQNEIKPTPVPETPAEPTKKPVPNNDSTRQIKSFVERIYVYVLDREPEEGGSNFWTAQLYNFDNSGAEVAQGFIFSEEFVNRNTSNEEFVTILYKTFFGRDPEEEGMNFWLGQLSSGAMSRTDVANGFIFSQEWADTCAKYGIRSGGTTAPTINIEPTKLTRKFVERMYTTAMNRNYDEAGRDYWAGELANFRVSGEQVGASFFLSDEMNGFGLDDGEYINRLYLTFMDRAADDAGKSYWAGFLSEGHTRAEVVYGFTRSPEFVQKCIDARILPF